MDDAGNVSEDGEEDVDEEVCTAAALKEDTEGREEDGEDDLANVTVKGVSFDLCLSEVGGSEAKLT